MRSFRVRAATSRRTHSSRGQSRPGATERGYDAEWARLAKRHKAAFPTCQYCDQRPVHETDHITPINGLDDPNRLRWSNLKSACRRCHARKTWRDKTAQQIAKDRL